MQTIGLPRHVTRGAALASRLCAKEHSDAAHRRDILKRWHRARDNGLSAAAAADAVGVSRATLYRWRKLRDRRRLAPQSRRPHHLRRPAWAPALVKAVHEARADYPTWGKAKLTVVLRRQGYRGSQSTIGRILKALVENGAVSPVPALRRKAPRAARRNRPHARRLPKGRKPTTPGEIVQLDTLTINPGQGRPIVKQFTACDPVAKWTCAQAWRRATAHNAKRFLDKLLANMPFHIEAIQVDGGSEFKADFEHECQKRGIDLFELPPRSPELNAHVERNNGTWRYEFYATWDLPNDDLDDINRWIDAVADEFNTFRPHQALDGHTPAEYLQSLNDKETPPHRLICREPGHRIDGRPTSPADWPRPHPPGKGRRMTEYETASLTASYIGLAIAAGNMLAAIVAAAGIWVFGTSMKRANENRAETEKNRHEQIMASFKDAAEDRKAALAQAVEDRKAAAEDRKAAQAAAAEDRKITQATLAALERQGDVLAEILRRTSPPPSQDGPQPGPAI